MLKCRDAVYASLGDRLVAELEMDLRLRSELDADFTLLRVFYG